MESGDEIEVKVKRIENIKDKWVGKQAEVNSEALEPDFQLNEGYGILILTKRFRKKEKYDKIIDLIK